MYSPASLRRADRRDPTIELAVAGASEAGRNRASAAFLLAAESLLAGGDWL